MRLKNIGLNYFYGFKISEAGARSAACLPLNTLLMETEINSGESTHKRNNKRKRINKLPQLNRLCQIKYIIQQIF